MALKLLTKMKDAAFDLLFPVRCAVCEKETGSKRKNRLICTDCLKTLSPSLDFYCPLCEAKTADGKLCFSCQQIIKNTGNNFSLDRLLHPFSYKDPKIQKAIKAFKYHFIKGLKEPLGRLMIFYLDKIKTRVELANSAIVAVPLHKRKFNQRGYNQSDLLADKVSDYLSVQIIKNCLIKIKSTKDQAKLKETER